MASAPTPPAVDALFGPFLIGVCVNCILYGVMLLQVMIYFMSYKKDPAWIRLFILYLLIAESVNVGCNIATIYEPLVSKYGTPAALKYFPIMITATPATNVAISAPIQIFTAWRVTVLTRKKWIGGIIIALALVSAVFAIRTAVIIAVVRVFAKKAATRQSATIWLITSSSADVLITATLYFTLSRRKTGFRSTDVMINRILRLTLQTGMWTLVFAMAEVILFLVYGKTTANFAIDFPLSKLYTNALLSTLNARLAWRKLDAVETKDQEDDNVLFGRGAFSEHTLSQASMGHQVSTIRSAAVPRPHRAGASITFGNSYEMDYRGDHRSERGNGRLPIEIRKEVTIISHSSDPDDVESSKFTL